MASQPVPQPSRYYSQDPALQALAAAPATPLTLDTTSPRPLQRIAGTFNRLGGIMQAIANAVDARLPAVLAIWYVESAGRQHIVNRAVIRFENHLFFSLWGRQNLDAYAAHYQHGGFQGTPGKAFQNHRFREMPAKPFASVHTDQSTEYRALGLGMQLAGEDLAVQAISIGGPQILVSNFALLGYGSGRAMYDAFQADERRHVLGFFDFCHNFPAPRSGGLITCLAQQNWADFARYYNGPGQIAAYSQQLSDAYQQAVTLPLT